MRRGGGNRGRERGRGEGRRSRGGLLKAAFEAIDGRPQEKDYKGLAGCTYVEGASCCSRQQICRCIGPLSFPPCMCFGKDVRMASELLISFSAVDLGLTGCVAVGLLIEQSIAWEHSSPCLLE